MHETSSLDRNMSINTRFYWFRKKGNWSLWTWLLLFHINSLSSHLLPLFFIELSFSPFLWHVISKSWNKTNCKLSQTTQSCNKTSSVTSGIVVSDSATGKYIVNRLGKLFRIIIFIVKRSDLMAFFRVCKFQTGHCIFVNLISVDKIKYPLFFLIPKQLWKLLYYLSGCVNEYGAPDNFLSLLSQRKHYYRPFKVNLFLCFCYF